MKRHFALTAFICFLLLAPWVLSPFSLTLMNYIGLYSLATLGLVLLTGVGGLTSFGQAAFAGLGAYCTAWLTTRYAVSPWIALVAALGLTLTVATILGIATLRLSGHYLPLATIAWAVSIFFIFGSVEELGGHTGMGGLPPIAIGSYQLRENHGFYYLIWTFVYASIWFAGNLLDSRPGRAMRALKGGMDVAQAMGVNVLRIKLMLFLVAAALACLSGWLYAHMQRFVNPTPFGLPWGIDYLFMAVVGGAGDVWGAVVGAALVTLLQQKLQDLLPHMTGVQGNLNGIAFGIVIILVLQRAPNGLWPLIARLAGAPKAPRRSVPERRLPRRDKTMSASPLLQVEEAVKRFGGLIAVNKVSFDVSQGEILALLGPNGAGKTTMFNLISGTLTPSAGRIMLNGERIDGLSPAAIAQRGVSRTFQHVRLLPGMSVRDNVALGAYLRTRQGLFASALHAERRDEAAVMSEVEHWLTRVGLKNHCDDAAGSLPLGKQRVVEIARALSSDPLLLLLDEPAAGLRLREKQDLARLLKDLRQDGLAILLVEHDMDFVMNLVDRAVVMSFGQKIAQGVPEEVQRNEAVLDAYLGSIA